MHPRKLSKFLSLILRHQPEAVGLQLDENGWANVDELLQKIQTHNQWSVEMTDLKEAVYNNDKQRFTFNEDETQIRANQGHSITIDLKLAPQTPPPYLYHGTATKNIASIRAQGINKGTRQHVHLSADKETATKVGQRHGIAKVLTIRTGKMHEDGIEFFLSKNGVWLTDFVAAAYIE